MADSLPPSAKVGARLSDSYNSSKLRPAPVRFVEQSAQSGRMSNETVPEQQPEQTVVRERFSKDVHSIMTYIGYIISPGNFITFPYLAFKNGGLPFILVYLMMMLVIGVPLSLVEMSLGQYSGENTVRLWDLSPAFRGLGFSMVLVSLVLTVAGQHFMTHWLFYAFTAIGHSLPWENCKESWTNCVDSYEKLQNLTTCSSTGKWRPCECDYQDVTLCSPIYRVAPAYYHHYEVLRLSGPGQFQYPDTLGSPDWRMVLVLLSSWICVWLCVVKGMSAISKIAFFFVLVPYVFLLILAIRYLLLPEASDGLFLIFESEAFLDQMAKPEMYLDAANIALITLSISMGQLHLLGRYNDFYVRFDRRVLVVAVVDFVSSLLCCLVVFLVLGYFLHQAGFSNANCLAQLVDCDRSLVFVLLPMSLQETHYKHVLIAVVFVMLYGATIHSVFGLYETMIAYLEDDFKIVRKNRASVRTFVAVVCFCLGVLVLSPGLDAFIGDLFDVVLNIVLTVIGLVEIVVVMWVYGVKQYVVQVEKMLTISLSPMARLTVCFYCSIVLPALLLVMLVGRSILLVKTPTMRSPQLTTAISVIILLPIPLWMGLHLWCFMRNPINTELPFRKCCHRLLKPLRRWGPNDGTKTRRNIDPVFADIFPSLGRKVNQTAKEVTLASSDSFSRELEAFLSADAIRKQAIKKDSKMESRSFQQLSFEAGDMQKSSEVDH